jgi:diacylglycerol O-acyltransferase / wax synthase
VETMSGLDAKFLYSETPTAHMHTIKVAVSDPGGIEGGFSFDTMTEVLGQLLVRLPPFRRRIVPVPLGLGHPVWVEDPDFDLRRHLGRVVLDPPGDDRALADAVGTFASTALPRDRPLWAIQVVEGLRDGRVAVVVKLHHAVADGSAAVALLRHVVEAATVAPHPAPPDDPWSSEPLPSRRLLVRRALHEQGIRLRGLPHLVRSSVTSARESERVRRSFDPMPPIPLHHIPRTSYNVSLDPARTFAMTRLPMDRLRTVRRATGTTLNDVYLAVCAGALRAYLAGRGELPDRPLVASVPVSTDPDAARLSGNRVDNLYVAIATDVADPAERLARIHDGVRASKEVRARLGHDLLEQRADVVPPQLYQPTVRLWSRSHAADHLHPPLNVILSNVAGPAEPIRIGPVTLEALYSVGPILEGIGLNITAWSYEDDLGVSLIGCPSSLPDPWPLVAHLHDALDELHRAVGRNVPADR